MSMKRWSTAFTSVKTPRGIALVVGCLILLVGGSAFLLVDPLRLFHSAKDDGSASRTLTQSLEEFARRFPKQLDKLVYPYSVVPGGVADAEAVKRAMSTDPVVRAHYQGIDLNKLTTATLSQDRTAYVSFRKGDKVFWTTKKIRLFKGETLLTDGVKLIRARCGNLISDAPIALAALQEPPEDILNSPIMPSGPLAHLELPPGYGPAGSPTPDVGPTGEGPAPLPVTPNTVVGENGGNVPPGGGFVPPPYSPPPGGGGPPVAENNPPPSANPPSETPPGGSPPPAPPGNPGSPPPVTGGGGSPPPSSNPSGPPGGTTPPPVTPPGGTQPPGSPPPSGDAGSPAAAPPSIAPPPNFPGSGPPTPDFSGPPSPSSGGSATPPSPGSPPPGPRATGGPAGPPGPSGSGPPAPSPAGLPPVPEPSTWVLIGGGVALLAALARRRTRARPTAGELLVLPKPDGRPR